MLPSDAAVGSLGWMLWGACQGEDPELFFPFASNGAAVHQITAAKAVCARCPVRAACLAYALTTRQDGIWGGTTPEERRALRQHPGSPPLPAPNPARNDTQASRDNRQLAGRGVLNDILARWQEAHKP